MLSVKEGGIKYHLKVFGMTRPGIEPRSPGPLTNTIPTRPRENNWMHTFSQGISTIWNTSAESRNWIRVAVFISYFRWSFVPMIAQSAGLYNTPTASLQNDKTPANEHPDMTLNNLLQLWGMQSTPSLPSLPDTLWPGVVVPEKFLSRGQIELNCVLKIAWNSTAFWR